MILVEMHNCNLPFRGGERQQTGT